VADGMVGMKMQIGQTPRIASIKLCAAAPSGRPNQAPVCLAGEPSARSLPIQREFIGCEGSLHREVRRRVIDNLRATPIRAVVAAAVGQPPALA
jgi:hypothetical protein